jgi:hypothetical protein
MTHRPWLFTFSAVLVTVTLAQFSAVTKAQSLFVANGQQLDQFSLDGTLLSHTGNSQGVISDVVASGDSLFATTLDGGTIQQYTTAGSLTNPSLVTNLPQNSYGIATDGPYLYVVSDPGNGSYVVGKYTTSGAVVNASLITSPVGRGATGIAVDGNDIFVTTFDIHNSLSSTGSVSEYTTAGALINASLISGLSDPEMLAISDGKIYIPNGGTSTVGVYSTSGAAINADLITGFQQPTAIAVYGDKLFVGSDQTGVIGEYNTSGALVNPQFAFTSQLYSIGMTVVAPEPSTAVLMLVSAGLFFGINGFKRIRATRRSTAP